MRLDFEKYQGTGNDFIMLDNRNGLFNVSDLPITYLCDRRFGIGADGVIVIENHQELDFHMIYFNPDRSQSFCGNGSRCAVAFAKSLGIIGDETNFLSTDGAHFAKIVDGLVELKMNDVQTFIEQDNTYVINTGSPHYISFVPAVDAVDIVPSAHAIRYNEQYKQDGINVNFIEKLDSGMKIRTYERGVEAETLSCGTGVTAAALANFLSEDQQGVSHTTTVTSKGGTLSVRFSHNATGFHDIYLVGPAKKTFEGHIEVTQ
ncbi:MAG: diaminopimelate epimerase [Bacteroidia bacterium]